jgi:hypothetical protein
MVTKPDRQVIECNMNFPNDENGNILRKMSQRGDDLSKSREINFCFAFPDQLHAKNFAKQVSGTMNLESEVARYEERDMWEATVSKKMVPTHQEITKLEGALNRIAQLHNGEADGWGCFIVS